MKPLMSLIFLSVIILSVATVVAILASKMQSDAYNRLTGAKTTWKDAMWVELRVVDTPTK